MNQIMKFFTLKFFISVFEIIVNDIKSHKDKNTQKRELVSYDNLSRPVFLGCSVCLASLLPSQMALLSS